MYTRTKLMGSVIAIFTVATGYSADNQHQSSPLTEGAMEDITKVHIKPKLDIESLKNLSMVNKDLHTLTSDAVKIVCPSGDDVLEGIEKYRGHPVPTPAERNYKPDIIKIGKFSWDFTMYTSSTINFNIKPHLRFMKIKITSAGKETVFCSYSINTDNPTNGMAGRASTISLERPLNLSYYVLALDDENACTGDQIKKKSINIQDVSQDPAYKHFKAYYPPNPAELILKSANDGDKLSSEKFDVICKMKQKPKPPENIENLEKVDTYYSRGMEQLRSHSPSLGRQITTG